MKLSLPLFALAALATTAHAAERLTVTVTHDLAIARPAETIAIPWKSVNDALPHAGIQHIVVKDAAGRVLPHQVTNVAPEAKDPQKNGVAYGELLFQHDFAPGEKRATFTVEKTDAVVPPFPTKVWARIVPERLDDFAWENDKVAHRTYGPALAAPAPAGADKEVLKTSGLDIWFKRVPYPIVDRWYNIGHDHYHHDEGEGIDMYNVGTTLGAGGTGIWAGGKLVSGINFTHWKVLANGPVRAIFELTYDGWDAAGTKVAEVKRFTVDAGHYFDRIDSTFTFAGTGPLQAAVGLNKEPADKGEDAKSTFTEDAKSKALVQWVAQKKSGDFGVAVILPSAGNPAFGTDARNAFMLAPVTSGQPLRYYVGAGWTRAGGITAREQWQRTVTDEAARVAAPVRVSLSAR
ncbi:DUF4861 domain-containing protein [Massilia sp. NEAU-DD11]|uniref:DUF4861 domain-containing protein n=1 Tax=Massilia cellulosiltytica TaxID=2683234 RepID=A0A7X3FXU7_9BURK|nr:DUF4861 family protein [Telluria cellulosilytica]MVW60021.1 DUF4861 domain-containing protein [Telluria cellulosilytica]